MEWWSPLSRADGWSFAFRPPAGGSLVPGIYEGAGALDVTTTPSRCETTTGRFQLIDLVLLVMGLKPH